jgi:hypothetical protein
MDQPFQSSSVLHDLQKKLLPGHQQITIREYLTLVSLENASLPYQYNL